MRHRVSELSQRTAPTGDRKPETTSSEIRISSNNPMVLLPQCVTDVLEAPTLESTQLTLEELTTGLIADTLEPGALTSQEVIMESDDNSNDVISELPTDDELDEPVCDGPDDGDVKHERVSAIPSSKKPSLSYIALISMAILNAPERKLLLSEIYTWVAKEFPYFRHEERSWRNSIRHNLSLNECFVKVGRSDNGKGHYWSIHPANVEDFSRGDFRRRRARRRVRMCTTGPEARSSHGFCMTDEKDYYVPMTSLWLPTNVLVGMFGKRAVYAPQELKIVNQMETRVTNKDAEQLLQMSVMSQSEYALPSHQSNVTTEQVFVPDSICPYSNSDLTQMNPSSLVSDSRNHGIINVPPNSVPNNSTFAYQPITSDIPCSSPVKERSSCCFAEIGEYWSH